MAYVGSGNVSSDELDMNIGNTTFNIYNTFLSVTGSIDSLTQNKQNLFLNNVSSTLTSNVANYNYDFRRNDTNGQNFYIGNSNTTTTAQSNLYLSGPNNNNAFSISVGNGSTTLTHNNSGNWGFNSAQSQNIYFQFNGATNLRMTSTAADFYYDIYVTGTTNLTGALNLTTKLDPKYILTSTGILSSTIMGYLINISSDVQTQLNNKQNLFLNNISSTLTSNIANYDYDFRRNINKVSHYST